LEYVEKTVAINEEYKNLLAKEKSINQMKERLKSYFSGRWRTLETKDFYKISAFCINNKGKRWIKKMFILPKGSINIHL
jgi:hypothetical protein